MIDHVFCGFFPQIFVTYFSDCLYRFLQIFLVIAKRNLCVASLLELGSLWNKSLFGSCIYDDDDWRPHSIATPCRANPTSVPYIVHCSSNLCLFKLLRVAVGNLVHFESFYISNFFFHWAQYRLAIVVACHVFILGCSVSWFFHKISSMP